MRGPGRCAWRERGSGGWPQRTWTGGDKAALSERKVERLTERAGAAPDLVVIAALHPWTCRECAATDGDRLIMDGDGPLCMRCARLDHLVFLPAGDAGLTRRARRDSGPAAVLVRFSRTRNRYERQGLLVEPAAPAAARKDPPAGGRAPARPDDPSDIAPHESMGPGGREASVYGRPCRRVWWSTGNPAPR